MISGSQKTWLAVGGTVVGIALVWMAFGNQSNKGTSMGTGPVDERTSQGYEPSGSSGYGPSGYGPSQGGSRRKRKNKKNKKSKKRC